MAAAYPFAHVAGHQPAVLGERRGRLLRPVPVAGEDARVLRLDLPGLIIQTEADVRIRLTDGAGPHPTRKVSGGHGGVLGHAVQLVDRHPDAGEELQYLGRNGRRTGSGVPAASQAEALLEGPEHQGVADQVQESALRGVEATVGHLLPADQGGQIKAEPQPEPLEGRGVAALDQHRGVELLPDAGHGKEQGGLDLAQVHRDRLDRLGEVEAETAGDHVPGGEDALRHVAQR